jgi:hypothetical protein
MGEVLQSFPRRVVRGRPVRIFRSLWSSSGSPPADRVALDAGWPNALPCRRTRIISAKDHRYHRKGALRGWQILSGRSRMPPTVRRWLPFPRCWCRTEQSLSGPRGADRQCEPSPAIRDGKNGRGRSRTLRLNPQMALVLIWITAGGSDCPGCRMAQRSPSRRHAGNISGTTSVIVKKDRCADGGF